MSGLQRRALALRWRVDGPDGRDLPAIAKA
jgi:hypothetical protein